MNKQEKAELIEKLANEKPRKGEKARLYNEKVWRGAGFSSRSTMNMFLVRHCIVEEVPPQYKIKLKNKGQ